MAEVGLDHLWVREHFARWTEHESLPSVEHEHLVADGEDRLHHVLNDDDRHAAGLEIADELQRGLDLAGAQPSHDLIEEQQPRLQGQRLRELQPPGVGDRQLARRPIPELEDADLGEDLVGLLERRRHPPGSIGSVEDPDRDVLADRHAAEGLDDLEGPSDPGLGDDPRLDAGEVTTVDQDGPRRGLEVPGDEVDEGALAGPVGADDTEGEAFGDAEAHVVDGLEAAETNPQAPGLQDGHRAHSRYLLTLASNE